MTLCLARAADVCQRSTKVTPHAGSPAPDGPTAASCEYGGEEAIVALSFQLAMQDPASYESKWLVVASSMQSGKPRCWYPGGSMAMGQPEPCRDCSSRLLSHSFTPSPRWHLERLVGTNECKCPPAPAPDAASAPFGACLGGGRTIHGVKNSSLPLHRTRMTSRCE